MLRHVLVAVSVLASLGCSSGIDRLREIGATATEQLVNFKTETGFEMINMRMVDVPAEVDFDQFLEVAPSVRHFKVLRVFGHQLSCEQIDQLVALGGFTTLVFENCEIPSDCLARLSQIKSIETLSITNSPIKSEDLAFITELPVLNALTLVGTEVDDSLADLLASIPTLRDVIVSKTSISDAFVDRLISLPKLREVHLDDTQVTAAGVIQLAGYEPVTRIHAAHLPLDDAILDAMITSRRLKTIVLDVSEKQVRENRSDVKLLPRERAMERGV